MKRHTLFLLFFTLSLSVFAQKPTVYLFPEFTKGTVYLKNFTRTTLPMNYDAANKKLCYQQDGVMMELEDNANVDSLVIGGRLFIPYRQRFLEYVPLADNHSLLVDWNLIEKYTGLRQGTGLNPHSIANVQAVNVGALYARQPDGEVDNNIIVTASNNEYTFIYHDKRITFRDRKSLLKHLPAHKEEVREFISNHHIGPDNLDEAIQVVEYFFSL